jgi:hypothetical protein
MVQHPLSMMLAELPTSPCGDIDAGQRFRARSIDLEDRVVAIGTIRVAGYRAGMMAGPQLTAPVRVGEPLPAISLVADWCSTAVPCRSGYRSGISAHIQRKLAGREGNGHGEPLEPMFVYLCILHRCKTQRVTALVISLI